MTATIAAPTQVKTSTQVKTPVRVVTATVRSLVGLLFTVTGANGFLNFMPGDASGLPEGALKFTVALFETGYMLPLVAGVQLVAGILFLLNRFVPLALAVLAPIVVGIFAFHVFLEPSGLVLAGAIAAAEVYLAWAHRDAFRGMLRAK
ncbi:hypothetical protein SAMN05421504_108181 [Amycolatopsis xylanica]|uniref:DoxX protein n=1 Tax=Amycolatopsis xylanica TaxID=589385 RepID=A0A1H3PEZ0_9PSEU|nr:hypothetical protein [Amycolatopsis xylanica]SDY99618.1 hypothetical protein SAMN05421504_108181 [Amycolatopsis xylanica]